RPPTSVSSLVHFTLPPTSPTDFFPRFIFPSSGALRDLHSFPTRRSSDLLSRRPPRSPDRPPTWVLTPSRGPFWPHPCSPRASRRSEEHTSELQSRFDLVCRLLLEKKKKQNTAHARRSIADQRA